LGKKEIVAIGFFRCHDSARLIQISRVMVMYSRLSYKDYTMKGILCEKAYFFVTPKFVRREIEGIGIPHKG
jgi:hypothetical protein